MPWLANRATAAYLYHCWSYMKYTESNSAKLATFGSLEMEMVWSLILSFNVHLTHTITEQQLGPEERKITTLRIYDQL